MRTLRALGPILILFFFGFDPLRAAPPASGPASTPAPALPPVGEEKTERLPLRRAIELALTNNLDVRWNRTEVQANRHQVRYEWGAFDPVFSTSLVRESLRIPQNEAEFISTGQVTGLNRIYSEDNVRGQAGLEGRIPLGTTYQFGLRFDRLQNTLNRNLQSPFNPYGSLYTPEYDSFMGVTLTQPLLRGFGTDTNLAQVRIARKNKEISELTWEGKVIETVSTVMLTYFDMLYGHESIRLRQEAIEADKRMVHDNQRRMDLGLRSPYDVRQAELAVSTDEESLVEGKAFFKERQLILRSQISKEFSPEEETLFLPTGSLETTLPQLDRISLIREAFKHRLDYRQALKEAEIGNIKLRYARNQLWPRLDLVGTYGFNGIGRDVGDSFNKATDNLAPQWSVGFQASIPLGNVQARATVSMFESQKREAILKIKKVEVNISMEVDIALNRIETARQSLETSRQTRRLAEEAMKIQNKQIEEGLISSIDAILTQKKLYDAREREIASAAQLNKSLVQLWVATGTLLQRQGISVD